MTAVCRQRSIRWKNRPCNQSLLQIRKGKLSQSLQYILHLKVSVKSVTPIPISFDALTKDPVPITGCVVWNRRAVMVRTMASANDKREA